MRMTLIERINSDFKNKNGVYYLIEPVHNSFEDIYMKVRKAEGRIYNDDEVKHLPEIENSHRYFNEWRMRKKSMMMLLDYFEAKTKNKTVLEPGCGNGWLSNKLAGLGFSEVISLDVNITELEQAARVFPGKDNLIFVYGDIFGLPPFPPGSRQNGTRQDAVGGDTHARRSHGAGGEGGYKFDYIVLSSVIAYFKDLNTLIDSLLNKLNAGGEIHIIDSPFYEDKVKARERLIEYYSELGFGEMTEYYHPHSFEDLKGFNYSTLHNPHTVSNRIKRLLDSSLPPFHWIKITH